MPSDSSGVLALLRPRDEVDVQVVTGDRGENVKLRQSSGDRDLVVIRRRLWSSPA